MAQFLGWIADYYRDSFVSDRMTEFCGGKKEDPAGTLEDEYVVGFGCYQKHMGNKEGFTSEGKASFWDLCSQGHDMFASVYNRKYTKLILDVERKKCGYEGDNYLDAHNAFRELEPAYQAGCEIFQELGIDFMTLMTGQGYHFISKVGVETDAHKRLERIGHRLPDSLVKRYSASRSSGGSKRRKPVPLNLGHAYEGMGRVAEVLVYKIIERAYQRGLSIPSAIGDVEVKGRAIVNWDMSMYGDPLHMRDHRIGFSTHQKAQFKADEIGDIAHRTAIKTTLPRRTRSLDKSEIKNYSLEHCLSIRDSFEGAKKHAREVSCEIPEGSVGIDNLVDEYLQHPIYQFHRYMDSDVLDWNFRGEKLPPCASFALGNPNPHLKRPTNLINLTRSSLPHMHPEVLWRKISEKYFLSGDPEWIKYNADVRAKFWVRVYGARIYAGGNGGDGCDAHNCLSQQEIKYCLPNCGGPYMADTNPHAGHNNHWKRWVHDSFVHDAYKNRIELPRKKIA